MEKEGLFVGLIPDGNRSWKKEHDGLMELARPELVDAYRTGAERVKKVIEAAREEGIRVFATWGLSTKNLEARDNVQKEVLFETFKHFLEELRDVWMDKEENKAVRFVHMGRTDRLREQAPDILELLHDVSEHTRKRAGMVLALGLDYDGLDEERRAHASWYDEGHPYGPNGWKYYLDLPWQIEEHQQLDEKGNLSVPVNLILRTKTAGVSIFHDNEYLHCYRNETRIDRIDEYLPALTPELFRQHLEKYRGEKMKKGA